MKILFFMFMFFSTVIAFTLSDVRVNNFKVANGKTALIEFNKSENIEYKSVEVGKKSFKIFENPLDKSKDYVLIPFSYYEKAQNRTLYIKYKEHQKVKIEAILLEVINGEYEKEEIHVDDSKVNPKSKAVKRRIAKEYTEAMKIYGTITPQSYLNKKFIEPLNSKITSAFGKARVYNGSLKGYHSGTDFRAKMGTPIIAANDGKIVLVEKRFYSGGTVIIDHGEGIYTCYFHMSKFSVKEGIFVKRGEILGLSGKSGRVTGPHLHFSARINKVQVDPLQLISLMNNNLLKGKNK